MQLFAYLYTNPLLEPTPDLSQWKGEIVRVYHDRALAGSSGETRPQWQQLMQDCQQYCVDGIVLRQVADLGESLAAIRDRLTELETLNLPLILLSELSSDSSSLSSQFLTLSSQSLQHLQDLQHTQHSRRIAQGHARNRVNALPPPGKAPYGYRRGKTAYVIDRTTAPVVKAFFEQFLLYGSLRGAVRYLAKRYNKTIAPSTGQRWLTNPVYRGDLAYQDGNWVRDAHPAILSRDEAAQVDRLLRRNRRLSPRSASAPRSLAGLVKCSQCQSGLTIVRVTSRRSQEYLYLRPQACPLQPKCSSVPYNDVLQATIDQICQDLPQVVSGVELPDITAVKQGMEQAIATKQTLLTELPHLIQQGILDSQTVELRAYTLRTEIAELENHLAQLPPVDLKATAQTLSITQFWLDLSESERRAYLRELVREIQLIHQENQWHLRLIFSFMPIS